MININIIHADQQATQALHADSRLHPVKGGNAFIQAGSLGPVSWAFVTEDVYFPVHRKGAFDFYIYSVCQAHATGDLMGEHRLKAGDMLVMQSGSVDYPVVKPIGPKFCAFEFWYSTSGLLQGNETPDFIKIVNRDFPHALIGGVTIKHLFGDEAPINNINDLKITEIRIPEDNVYTFDIQAGRKTGIFVISGRGKVNEFDFINGDFIEVSPFDKEHENLTLLSLNGEPIHLIILNLKENADED